MIMWLDNHPWLAFFLSIIVAVILLGVGAFFGKNKSQSVTALAELLKKRGVQYALGLVFTTALAVASIGVGWWQAKSLTTSVLDVGALVDAPPDATSGNRARGLALREHHARALVAYGVAGAFLSFGLALSLLGLSHASVVQEHSMVLRTRNDSSLANAWKNEATRQANSYRDHAKEHAVLIRDISAKIETAGASFAPASSDSAARSFEISLAVLGALAKNSQEKLDNIIANIDKITTSYSSEQSPLHSINQIDDAPNREHARFSWETAPGAICLLIAGVITALTAMNEPMFQEPAVGSHHDVRPHASAGSASPTGSATAGAASKK